MVAKSITHLSNGKNHKSLIHQCNKLFRGLVIFISSVLLIGLLSSCSPTESTPGSLTTSSPTPEISPTVIPEPTDEPEDTVTPTQYISGTPIAFSFRSGNIFLPAEIPVTFSSELEDLPSGSYLIDSIADAEENFEELRYVFLHGDEEGSLILVRGIVNLKDIFFNHGTTRAFGGFPIESARYVFDLSSMESYKFDVCQERRPAQPSPGGDWLVTICTGRGEVQGGIVAAEVISLLDGTTFTMEIPASSGERTASNLIRWVTNDRFIAEVGDKDEPCLIDLLDQSMNCASVFRERPLISVSPKGTFLLFNRSSGYSWIKEIFLTRCFDDQSKCNPIAILDDEYSSSDRMDWSPDETMLAVDFGEHLTSSTAEIGFYDTETWTYHQLGVFPRSYGFFDWCPDSSCLIIVGEESFLLYLDGKNQPIQHELNNPIAVIEIP